MRKLCNCENLAWKFSQWFNHFLNPTAISIFLEIFTIISLLQYTAGAIHYWRFHRHCNMGAFTKNVISSLREGGLEKVMQDDGGGGVESKVTSSFVWVWEKIKTMLLNLKKWVTLLVIQWREQFESVQVHYVWTELEQHTSKLVMCINWNRFIKVRQHKKDKSALDAFDMQHEKLLLLFQDSLQKT